MYATKDMCYCCFNAILDKHIKCKFDNIKTLVSFFVTWKKNNKTIGCIGIHSSLINMLKFIAVNSFNDDRFPKNYTTDDYLKDVTVIVSILYGYNSCNLYNDWTIGINGIRISYKDKSALFLPEVAEENKWNHEETIKHLMIKMDYNGDISDLIITKFKTNTETVSYSEYINYEKNISKLL